MGNSGTILALVLVASAVYIAALFFIEVKAMKKGNSITAVMRGLVQKLPWPFILLALVSGCMMGHCFLQ